MTRDERRARLHEARVHTLNALDVNVIKACEADEAEQAAALAEGWTLQEIADVQLAVRIA